MNATLAYQPFVWNPAPPAWEYPLRLGATLVTVGLVGVERQLSRSPTGFGTYVLVSLAACCASIVAMLVIPANPLVLMSGTISGVAFLGAGALIRSSNGNVFGFVTASLVVAAAFIGLSFGIGLYIIALLLWGACLVVLATDRIMARWGFGSHGPLVVLEVGFPQIPVEVDSNNDLISVEQVSEMREATLLKRRGARAESHLHLNAGVAVVNQIENYIGRRHRFTVREIAFDAINKRVRMEIMIHSGRAALDELVSQFDILLGELGVDIVKLDIQMANK